MIETRGWRYPDWRPSRRQAEFRSGSVSIEGIQVEAPHCDTRPLLTAKST